MPRTHCPIAATKSLAVATGLTVSCLCGCASNVRIPDATPPVDIEPVTAMAGYGMELRIWALDAKAWKRSQNNAELEQLYRAWLAIEAQRTVDEQETESAEQPADEPPVAGPPVEEADEGPKTFEQYVQTQRAAVPIRPGLEDLARYSNIRDSLDRRGMEVWQSNGLEFALVPINDLGSLRSSMGVPGPLERTWWGATTTWSHMAKGIFAGNRTIETDMGPLVLGPGRLALVGRAWPAPGVKQPVLRLELCPQFLPVRSQTNSLEARLTARLTADDNPPDALDEGPVFERLALQGSIPRGYALIVAPAVRTELDHRFGPDIPVSSLAEALLSAVGPDGAARPVALVVVPVLPERFSLDGG